MTIFKTAYDTTVGSGFITTKLDHALQEALIRNFSFETLGINWQNNMYVYGVTGIERDEINIPVFTHPYVVKRTNSDNQYLFGDFRTVVGSNRDKNGHPVVKNTTEFNLIKSRLILNLIWLVASPGVLRDISIIPAAVYASWISEGVGNRFALDPKERFELAILAAAFYNNLFRDEVKFDDEIRMKMEATAIKATKAPYVMVRDTVAKIENFSNIREFCDTVKSVLQNSRLDDLNPGLLVTILGGGWFGTNAREILAVACEHPPTWIALVFASLKDRTYRNSNLAKISERYGGGKGGDTFIKAFVQLVDSYQDDSAINADASAY